MNLFTQGRFFCILYIIKNKKNQIFFVNLYSIRNFLLFTFVRLSVCTMYYCLHFCLIVFCIICQLIRSIRQFVPD